MAGQISTVLNAELFDSPDSFSYRDIQRLCVRLKLGGKGKREALVLKLQEWHRSRSPEKKSSSAHKSKKSSSDSDSDNEDENHSSLPMNVIGQRFCLMPINVAADPNKLVMNDNIGKASSSTMLEENIPSKSKASNLKRRRSSIIGNEGLLAENVSPRLLNPLTAKNDLFSPKSAVKSGYVMTRVLSFFVFVFVFFF